MLVAETSGGQQSLDVRARLSMTSSRYGCGGASLALVVHLEGVSMASFTQALAVGQAGGPFGDCTQCVLACLDHVALPTTTTTMIPHIEIFVFVFFPVQLIAQRLSD